MQTCPTAPAGVRQQAPIVGGGPQSVGEHCAPAWNVPPIAVQTCCVVTTQPPDGVQQAPCGTVPPPAEAEYEIAITAHQAITPRRATIEC